jgi:hypothetical protein
MFWQALSKLPFVAQNLPRKPVKPVPRRRMWDFSRSFAASLMLHKPTIQVFAAAFSLLADKGILRKGFIWLITREIIMRYLA